MRGALLVAILLLAACQERSFDERYADTARQIREKAAGIDAELASQAALAEPTGSATRVVTPAPAGVSD